MGIDIKVNAFEGPLDLLLHLIEKNKVDIYDIPISEITSQYLDYIRSMEEEDLDVMSDFLVMAATLLKIKAKMLLPVKEEEEEEELTGEQLNEMDFEELEDICEDKSLDTDPDDYDEDEVEKLRKAVAKELGINLPKKQEKKSKSKKGKK